MRQLLIVGGLLLVLFGSVYGAVYAGLLLPEVKHEQDVLLKRTVELAYESPTAAKKQTDAYIKNVHFANRMASVHSHMTLIGMLSLALSGLLSFFHISKGWLWTACILLLASGIILPFGVFAETWQEMMGGIIAVTGGILLLFSIVIFLVGALKSKPLNP